MRKSAVISGQNLSVPFLALFLILLFSAISFAESLSDVKRILTEHQSQPLERIKTLKNEVIKIQGLEEGLARQYRIPVSQVINYEMMLENNIHVYHSIYFLQKQGTAASQFILEEGRLEELAEKAPPYSFLLYLDFLEDVENYRNEAERYQRLIEKAKSTLLRNNTDMTETEKRFRVVNERIARGNGESLTNSWRMREIKAKLEECTAINTLYMTTLSLAEMGAKVFSIERQKELYDFVSTFFFLKKYTNLKRFYGDGFEGLPKFAPFDKVIITAAAPFIPPKLVEQLKPGGIMVAPVGDDSGQKMMRITKDASGNILTEELGDFSFVPMLQGRNNK